MKRFEMKDTKHIKISEYNYPLPDERIAKFPLNERDRSKLLVYRHGEVTEDCFSSLPNYLTPGEMMVFNNTKVIQARMHFRKDTGALIEVFCLEPIAPNDYVLSFQQTQRCSWLCMIGNLKKWKEGSLKRSIEVKNKAIQLTATRGECRGTSHWIDFEWDDNSITFADILEAIGELPIPPYLNRETQESDKETYQTVYSKIKGSVAAPTAGLHFTEKVLQALDERGIDREELTLHVGAGTFKPVKSEEIEGHEMHTEYISVNRRTIEKLIAHGGQTIAVGTTSVRTLESLYYIGVLIAIITQCVPGIFILSRSSFETMFSPANPTAQTTMAMTVTIAAIAYSPLSRLFLYLHIMCSATAIAGIATVLLKAVPIPNNRPIAAISIIFAALFCLIFCVKQT